MRTTRAAVSTFVLLTLAACGQPGSEVTQSEAPPSGKAELVDEPGDPGSGIMPETEAALVAAHNAVPGPAIVLMDAVDYEAASLHDCNSKSVTVSTVDPSSGVVTVAYSIYAKGDVRRDAIGLDSAGPDDLRLCGFPENKTMGSISGPALPISPGLDRHAATKGNAVGWVDMDAKFHEVATGKTPTSDFQAHTETQVERPWFDREGNFYYLESTKDEAQKIKMVGSDGASAEVREPNGVHVDVDGKPVRDEVARCLGGGLAWLDHKRIVTTSLEQRPAAAIATSGSLCTDYVGIANDENQPLIAGAPSEKIRGAAASQADKTLYFGYGGSEREPEKLYRTSTEIVEEPVQVPAQGRLIGQVAMWKD